MTTETALALTFTDFVTEPLKHVGKALGQFLNGLLVQIPVFYQLIVLILIAAIIMATCYGASTTIGQALVYRNNPSPPKERLPPAEPPRPPYGNSIEGWHQPPYYIEPRYVPMYIQPRNLMPESLEALDVRDDRNHRRLPGLTDRAFPSRDPHGEQEWRREEITPQKPYREQREKPAIPKEESSDKKYQRTEELKERADLPRQDESSFSPLQKKEKSPVQNSIEEMADGRQQSKTKPVHKQSNSQEQMKVELVNQNAYGDHRRTEEPSHEKSSSLQQRENLVEEISHGERLLEERGPDDKSLELKGALKKDPSEQTIDGENKSGPL